MQKFTSVTGAVLPLDIDNLDTDQIIPKQFLRGLDKSGLAGGCLYNLRFNPDGSPDKDCVFNRPGFEGVFSYLFGRGFLNIWPPHSQTFGHWITAPNEFTLRRFFVVAGVQASLGFRRKTRLACTPATCGRRAKEFLCNSTPSSRSLIDS